MERDGIELTSHEFEMLHDAITSDVLRNELPQWFSGFIVDVDNDIDV